MELQVNVVLLAATECQALQVDLVHLDVWACPEDLEGKEKLEKLDVREKSLLKMTSERYVLLSSEIV